jgi:hypothetical protein
MPIVGRRPVCCAHEANGQATAAPPSVDMNRRLLVILTLPRREHALS